MPTLEELEAQVRRRPLGRTLVDICLDLAVVPGFCTGPFWNELFDSIRLHGGSVATLMREKVRREEAFCKEQDRKLGSNWDWQEMRTGCAPPRAGVLHRRGGGRIDSIRYRNTRCAGRGGGHRPALTRSRG